MEFQQSQIKIVPVAGLGTEITRPCTDIIVITSMKYITELNSPINNFQ